jgi:hypothetical protein
MLVSGQPVTATTGNFSGDVTLGSSVLATPTGSAPSYTCRAWVNFNGTGTVAIRASGNVTSITDNGTGDYTVNFTTAMTDANYSAVATCVQRGATGVNRCIGFDGNSSEVATTYSTTAVRLLALASNGAAVDQNPITVAIFR